MTARSLSKFVLYLACGFALGTAAFQVYQALKPEPVILDGEATVSWVPDPDYYKYFMLSTVYIMENGVIIETRETLNTELKIKLPPGRYCAFATSHYPNGPESGPSNVVCFKVEIPT